MSLAFVSDVHLDFTRGKKCTIFGDVSSIAWLSTYDIVLAGKYSLIEAHVLNEDPASGPVL